MQLFYQDMHLLQQNNYSYERFSYDGIDRSKHFNVQKHVEFMTWFQNNYQNVHRAWRRLSDQKSRELFIDLIRYRLAGHLHVRIGTRVHDLMAEADACKQAFRTSVSSATLSGMFGRLVRHEGDWHGTHYEIDTVADGILATLVYGQYYFDRGGITVRPEAGDHVVDAGAFTGEVSAVFAKTVGPNGRVYAFDPVRNHAEICALNFSRQGCENITFFPYAVGAKAVDAPMAELTEYNPGYRPSSSAVPVATCRIDDLVNDGRIERIDFLKMDIEGAEMAALHGAKESIRRFTPRLAISIYHKPEDFCDIINYIHDLRLGYSLYIDQHTIYDEETVLYAKPPEPALRSPVAAEPKNKVFCLGFSKTGTTSMEQALDILDYDVCRGHWNSPHTYYLLALYVNRDFKEILRLTRYWDAFADGPWGGTDLYHQLLETYPNAKYILTERDPEAWYASFEKLMTMFDVDPETALESYHASGMYGSGYYFESIFGVKALAGNKKKIIDTYVSYNNAVKEQFRRLGKELLVLDLAKENDAWGKICAHLGQPVPAAPFPHENRARDNPYLSNT